MRRSTHPHILLVDDSDDDAFLFRFTVKATRVACEVTHLEDGGRAFAYLEEARAGAHPTPDLVFLDLKLPGASGFEILGWIRQQQWPTEPRVYILSGSEQDSDIAESTRLGATGYFAKPLKAEQFKGCIATLDPAGSLSR